MADPAKTSNREGHHPEQEAKSPNLIERAKEVIEPVFHRKDSPPHHDKETHGTSDDIDQTTPAFEVKGPNVFERVKEEIEAIGEAIVEAIHHKKNSEDHK